MIKNPSVIKKYFISNSLNPDEILLKLKRYSVDFLSY